MNSAAEELGVERADIAHMKKQRLRNTLARLFRAVWVPAVTLLCALSAGAAATIIYNRADSYPFAAIGLAAVAPATIESRPVSRILLVYLPLALFGFVVGLKAGEIISPQRHLAVVAEYGVVHKDVIME